MLWVIIIPIFSILCEEEGRGGDRFFSYLARQVLVWLNVYGSRGLGMKKRDWNCLDG